MSETTLHDWVGPVLQASLTAEGVAEAFRELNEEVDVVDHGSYLRILAPPPCRVTKVAIEAELGREFRMPADLEAILSSFKGRISKMDENEAVWDL